MLTEKTWHNVGQSDGAGILYKDSGTSHVLLYYLLLLLTLLVLISQGATKCAQDLCC